MTARDDAIDSRLRAMAQEALAELGRAPGYDRDVPPARRHGSLRTLTLAAGLAAAVGAAGAAIGIGLHQSGQHGNVPAPATSPTPSNVPSTPTPSATPVPGSLGNDLIYTSPDVPGPMSDVTTLTEHDWTWAVRGQLTLPKPYPAMKVIASPHGSHVLLIDGSVVVYSDAVPGPIGVPATLTELSSGGQATNIPTPSGLELTYGAAWSDDESAVCASFGKSTSTGNDTTTDDFYVLKPGSAPRKMGVPIRGRATRVLACGATTDTMVVDLTPMVGPSGGAVQDEIFVVRMSTGAVLRHFLLPTYDPNGQTRPSVAVSADGSLLSVSVPVSASSTSLIEDSTTGRTLGTVAVPVVNFFTGLNSIVFATDGSGRSVLVEWQTGQRLPSDWLQLQGIQAVAIMFHPGHAELLVESGRTVYLLDASQHEHQVADATSVFLPGS